MFKSVLNRLRCTVQGHEWSRWETHYTTPAPGEPMINEICKQTRQCERHGCHAKQLKEITLVWRKRDVE